MDEKKKIPRGYVRGKDGKLKKKRLVIVDKPKPVARLLASTVRPRPPPPPPPRPTARLLASTVRPPPPPPPDVVEKKKKQKKPRKRLVIIPDPIPPRPVARLNASTIRPPPPPPPPPPPARPFVAVKTDVAKPLNYTMLPDEMRRDILKFAGAKSPSDAARDELIALTTQSVYRPVEKIDKVLLDRTYVFFVINNTLDKMNLYTLEEDGVETTYKKTPRARTIFLRDPVEVLNEYRDDYIYDEIIEKSLARVKGYKKLMENATFKESDKEYKPTDREQTKTMRGVVHAANKKNLLKDDFFPKVVEQVKKGGWTKNTYMGVQREMIINFRTDGIIDYISGGLGFGVSSWIHLLVVMERLYINSNSEEDFNEIMKMMNSALVKDMKEAIVRNKEMWRKKDAVNKKYFEDRDEMEKRREELKRMQEEIDAFDRRRFGFNYYPNLDA